MIEQEIPKQRILVIDDTAKNIQVIGAILREEDYLISIASSGKMALEAIEKSIPDLILLDIMMPEMDGYEVCRRIKSNPLTQNIPVIFLSAITETLDKVKAFGLGAVDYITKPIESKELLARVNAHLKIDSLQKKLMYVNKNLERLVEMRTRELQKTQSYLANVIDSMPSSIIGFELNGDITNLNQEAKRVASLLSGDVLRKDIREVFPAYDKFYDEMFESLNHGRIFSKSKLLFESDAGQKYFNLKSYPLYIEDEIVGGILRIDDVTETIRLEKLKTRFEKEKMAALGDIVVGVAHEINTPVGGALTSMSGLKSKTDKIRQQYSSNNMTQTDFEKFLKTADQFEDIVLENINRAADVVSHFKGIAVQYDRDEISSFYIKERIELILETMAAEIKEKNCAIELNCPQQLEVILNIKSFDQIIGNLLSNSLIHGFENIQGGVISIDIELQQDMLVIIYSDNGQGISLEDEDRVFTPFFTTKRGTECIGLGLAIIYNLVTLKMGGKMSFVNTVDKGISYTIKLMQVD